MSIRNATMAGTFYPSTEKACRSAVAACVADREERQDLEKEHVFGGVVPHAGWTYSGSVAGGVYSSIANTAGSGRSYILFGAVHRRMAADTALYSSGAWETPIGRAEIDGELAGALLEACEGLIADESAHAQEHSLEVQVPFIQHLDPTARIVPIMVAPRESAVVLGQAVGEVVRGWEREVVFIGSSDLTHYGPRFGFTPEGTGHRGIRWAKEVNDRRMIELLLGMQAERIVDEARRHRNACGSGAIAATVSACRTLGANRGMLLAHRNSVDAEEERAEVTVNDPQDAVGYAGVVFV